MESKRYENFPIGIVALSNGVSLAIYGLGLYILSGLGIAVASAYLLYCLWMELILLRGSCIHCYYYGKTCAFGKGRLCSLFFKRGDPQRFAQKEFSWKDMLPDLLVTLFPLVGGIILLIRQFDWLLLGAIVLLLGLTFAGNAVIRGTFACTHCKQRDLGCPAEQLFNKQA